MDVAVDSIALGANCDDVYVSGVSKQVGEGS
jgi:hypothetical protein